jgi:iduronate 2-sulfatase
MVVELRRPGLLCVRYMDSKLGRVLDSLEANGFLNDTVVLFWGGHG